MCASAISAPRGSRVLSATSLARLGEVHPELARRIKQLDALLPALSIQVTQGYRTWADQDALYAEGRTTAGPNIDAAHPLGFPVTKARGGQSAHNFGYAVDLVPEDVTPGTPDWNSSDPAWQKMLAAGLTCGLAEGARWRSFVDTPHFYLQELPADPTDEMRALLEGGGIQALWDSWAPLISVGE